MTMQIKGVQIAGLPAIKVRNMLRGVHSVLDQDYVAGRCNLSGRLAKQVIQELVSDGYLELNDRTNGVDYYKLTPKGVKLSMASAASKMPRAKAEQIVAGLMKRVEEINASTDYVYRVSTVIVFGSYARGVPFLSDVDIAIDLEGKWSGGEHKRREKERISLAFANGRRFPNCVREMFWPQNEIMLHLKARTRGLNFQHMDDFMDIGKDEDFAYKVLLGDAAQVAEALAASRVP
jgi:predicted nucleotidyltransferase/predicted transcriptional regulator